MKLKLKDLRNDNDMITLLVLSSITDECIRTLDPDRNDDTEIELNLSCNGVELDLQKFVDHLDRNWEHFVKLAARDQAEERFQKEKGDWMSKKSTNAQLDKIRGQMNKAFNMLKNIDDQLHKIPKR